jgi:iron complex outermembrane receptor protein
VKRFATSLFVVFLYLLAMAPARLHAQETATLSGSVVDPEGNAVQNAAIAARNESTGAVARTNSDDEGKFAISNLASGNYTVSVSAPGFALATRSGVAVSGESAAPLAISLAIGSVSEAITVEADTSGSVAAQYAPMDGLLEARSARTEVTPVFIQNFTSPVSDFSELLQMAPGTYSVNTNGVGLGQSNTFFRGFPDGDYDVNYDNVPIYDTNTPSHHSWVFTPSPWIGSVDFDRSPGDASTTGPTPFGGTINLESNPMPTHQGFYASVSYGSFDTLLLDGGYEGAFGASKKTTVLLDAHHMSSNGFETFNYQNRSAGMAKFQHKFSEDNVLTGFVGIVYLDTNTPNAKGPTRYQLANYGYNFINSNDSNIAELSPIAPGDPSQAQSCSNAEITAGTCLFPTNYHFYTYHVPTHIEYLNWTDELGRGWQINLQPYVYAYNNQQYYNNSYTTISVGSAVDKVNSYLKVGENFSASQSSKHGILRVGLWFEHANTGRYQTPSDPLTRVDQPFPNFHERFATETAQPFAEYQLQVTSRLTLTGGLKYAYFRQALTQFQDNGTTVGCLGGTAVPSAVSGLFNCVGGSPTTFHAAGYGAVLPSADANYRLRSNWSAYFQYASGTVVPPSSVFDVTGGNTILTPKPTGVNTLQMGTVLKLRNVSFTADLYHIHFQNTYTQINDPNVAGAVDFVQSGDSVSQGMEGEANIYLVHGFSLYTNATYGEAKYVSVLIPNAATVGGAAAGTIMVPNPNLGLWVANTPSDTEALGLTFEKKSFDIGMFDKRVGQQWNDNKGNTKVSGLVQGVSEPTPAVLNQAVLIDPFNIADLYINYTLHRGSRFDNTKFRLSFNNLFDAHSLVGVTPGSKGTLAARYTPNFLVTGDTLLLTPGRSITFTVTFSLSGEH